MIISNIVERITSKFREYIYKLILYDKSGSFLILKPLRIIGLKNIKICNRVYIGSFAWIEAFNNKDDEPSLVIGNKTTIADFVHIIALENIYIGENVLIASKVYITDNLHEYKDITMPIKEQAIINAGKVIIGDNSWIGENVCIIGSTIGKHSIIGANSVVTKDIPSYSVAVGIPAQVIKQYNFEKKEWEKVNEKIT